MNPAVSSLAIPPDTAEDALRNPMNCDRERVDRELVDRALERYLAPPPGCPSGLAEAMRYAVLGPGKRLRPLLVLAAARACGAPVEPALPAAAAVEMIHAYSLVHDDLPAMDDDDLRRGRPTCHIRYGEATAILVGDSLIPLAFETLARHILPAARAVRSVLELAQAAGCGQLAGGQADDLAPDASQSRQSPEFLESVHLRKTAALIAVSLKLGGIAVGAEEPTLAALEYFGQRLGLAFQITDDLLDFQGDPVRMGKRADKDTQRGKITSPALLGVDACRDLAARRIAEGVEALIPLGEPAEPLRVLARSILDRTH